MYIDCPYNIPPFNTMKTAQISDEGVVDGGTPYTDTEMGDTKTFSFGATPEDLIKERVMQEAPSGYPMQFRSNAEWKVLADAVNQGIDSHLEGFTRSTFDHETGNVLIHPEEMTTLLRRLYENGDDEAWSLRTDILGTLGIEEV